MTSLLSRLQSATGPSRELDAEIALANGWTFQKLKPANGRGGDNQAYWRKPGVTEWYRREKEGPSRYTESIDAALTLVPKGWDWGVGRCADGYSARADKGEGISDTPALALLIAIERAKEKV
jgi:hypothetical protein